MPAAATLLTLRVPDFAAALRVAVAPRLVGWPVVVATSFKPLGRVLAASPAARSAGVDADMPYPVARARCPDAKFFVPDKELAAKAMRAMVRAATGYAPLVESAGEGRILVDTRGTERLWGNGIQVAERLRRDVRDRFRLTASAGLATERPWSQLASRAAGDDGAFWVAPGHEDAFLDLMPTAWIDDLEPRTRERLSELNIGRIGQLRQFAFEDLRAQFGPRSARALRNVLEPEATGALPVACHDASDAAENRVRIAAALTEATAAPERLRLVARTLAAQAAAELRARGLGSARLCLTILYTDGTANTVRQRTGGFVQDEPALVELSETMLWRAFTRRVQASRLWLEAERLSEPMRQGVLFGADDGAVPSTSAPPRRETTHLWTTIDRIRARYGDGGICPGALLEQSPNSGRRQHGLLGSALRHHAGGSPGAAGLRKSRGRNGVPPGGDRGNLHEPGG